MGAVRKDHVATGDRVSSIGDNFGHTSAGVREILPLLLSRADPHPHGQLMRTALFVGRSNLPLRVVLDPSFRAFMRGSTPSSQHPSLPELRDAILKIAEQFRVEFTPETEHGRYGNLMADTATSGRRTWLGVCVSTPRAFSFWRCVSIYDQTVATLVDPLKGICTDLKEKGFVVCSIVTGNASHEIAAVRELPWELGVPVFRIPCLSHTMALVLRDFVKDGFPLISGWDFFGAMIDLRSLLSHLRRRDAFNGILQPCETRWTSRGEFADYLVSHCVSICAFLQDKFTTRATLPAGPTMAFEVRFERLAPCLKLLNIFVKWTEGDQAFMADAWSESQAVFEEFVRMSRGGGNEYAARCSRGLYRRLSETADLSQRKAQMLTR
jgi:hypothetical protein